jgi:hypothetical protein
LRAESLASLAVSLAASLAVSLAASLAGSLAASLAGSLAADLVVSPAGGAWAATSAASAGTAAAGAAPIGTYLTREEIRVAAAKLRADPNLGGEQSLRTLRWKEANAANATPPPGWLTRLFDFLAQSSRLLLWIVGAVCAAIALVWAIRMLRARGPVTTAREREVTSSVQGLDIRPESLPEDIGTAALALLEAGREREALSLLYRGALSRAVHRHGIAILASATEGEALRAVNAKLDPPRAAYFADLVALWQRAVYAGERVSAPPIDRLCRGFAASLEGAAP